MQKLRPLNAPKRRSLLQAMFGFAIVGSLPACGGGGGSSTTPPVVTPPAVTPPVVPPPVVNGPAWPSFGRDAQHSGLGGDVASQPLSRLVWRTPVDLAPQYTSGGALLIHYGSPVITSRNTVVVPVKTGATGGFRIETHAGSNGALLWQAESDYLLPPRRWTPSFNATLGPNNRVYMPGAGGKVWFRDDADAATGALQSLVFYGASVYEGSKALYDSCVFINTPITVDSAGNIYFGVVVTAINPARLTGGGIVRIDTGGVATYVGAASASGNALMTKTAMNAAPALSIDQKTLYVAVNEVTVAGRRPSGMLLALDSSTLARKAAAPLLDPATGLAAGITDDSSASPTVGPDGDVYYGVLESTTPAHNSRGWLLHFDATLATVKTPGSFGWDDTVSIVPATMVPAYTGGSPYLLMSKYNNYPGAGTGDGTHRLALLDPRATQPDAFTAIPVTVMKEVYTILGVTPEGNPLYPNGVKEWCINAAAVDPVTRSVLINSEDGYLYRWDLATNRLSERISLNSGYGQAYTPTALGPDGLVYSVNNAVLTAVGR